MFRPPIVIPRIRLGQGIFDWVETSPGRIDPRSERFVESTALPEKERRGMFDWAETSPGRVNPRTGKLIRKTGRGEVSAPEEKRPDRLPFIPRVAREREDAPVLMSGSDNGAGSGNVLSDPILWFVIGFGVFLALEATGKTKILGEK